MAAEAGAAEAASTEVAVTEAVTEAEVATMEAVAMDDGRTLGSPYSPGGGYCGAALAPFALGLFTLAARFTL